MNNNRGLTLIELMVAVAVLCLGTTLIQEGLLRCLTLLGRYSHTLTAEGWMEERLWQAQEDTLYSTEAAGGDGQGQIMLGNRPYDWALTVQSLSGASQLYSFRLRMSWTESGVPLELVKERYATKPKWT